MSDIFGTTERMSNYVGETFKLDLETWMFIYEGKTYPRIYLPIIGITLKASQKDGALKLKDNGQPSYFVTLHFKAEDENGELYLPGETSPKLSLFDNTAFYLINALLTKCDAPVEYIPGKTRVSLELTSYIDKKGENRNTITPCLKMSAPSSRLKGLFQGDELREYNLLGLVAQYNNESGFNTTIVKNIDGYIVELKKETLSNNENEACPF